MRVLWRPRYVPWPPDFTLDRDVADLGPTDSYATVEDLDGALGAAVGSATIERRRLVLILATRWVAYRVGLVVTDAELPTPIDDLVFVPAPPAYRQATVAAAVRFYKSPEVPFGVAGGWDMATYVRMSIPDVDLLLYGQRQAFGIA